MSEQVLYGGEASRGPWVPPALSKLLLWYIRWSPIAFKKGGLYNRVVEPSLLRRPRGGIVRARFGAKFHFDSADLIQRYIYAFGVWEPAVSAFIAGRLRSGDSFVDVGSNIGYHTMLASRLVGRRGRVIAIEASPSIFELLRANVALNHAANVRLVHAAASDKSGTIDIFRAPGSNIGMSTVVRARGYEREGTVPSARLDSILTADEIAAARLVKIDVEGHEPAVLDGLMPALVRARPDLELLVEISPEELRAQGTSAEAVVGRLEAAGYHPYELDNRYEGWFYATGAHRRGAKRLETVPSSGVADLVFSRTDARALHDAQAA